MKVKKVDENSQYIFFMADNQTQHCLTRLLWERIGGTMATYMDSQELKIMKRPAVIVQSTFLIGPPHKDRIRIYIGHGTSDKPVRQFHGPSGALGMDYYLISGPKDAWLFHKYGHALNAPYYKTLKTGLLRSDYFLNADFHYYRENVLQEIEQWAEKKIPRDRKIVVWAPTFNTGSHEYYHFDLAKQLAGGEYFLLIKLHDREFFFSTQLIRDRSEDDEHWLYPDQSVQARIEANKIEYRGPMDPMKFLSVADYYIGDVSSLNYEAIFADIPMVIVRPYQNAVGDIPFEYDVRNCAPHYNIREDIKKALKQAEQTRYKEARQQLIETSFYYNDGHAIERACQHVTDKVNLLKDRLAGKTDESLKLMVDAFDMVQRRNKEVEKQNGKSSPQSNM